MGYEKGMRRTREGYEKWGAFCSYLNGFSVCQRTLLKRFEKVRAGQFVPLFSNAKIRLWDCGLRMIEKFFILFVKEQDVSFPEKG